jgi:hypothetical protein
MAGSLNRLATAHEKRADREKSDGGRYENHIEHFDSPAFGAATREIVPNRIVDPCGFAPGCVKPA